MKTINNSRIDPLGSAPKRLNHTPSGTSGFPEIQCSNWRTPIQSNKYPARWPASRGVQLQALGCFFSGFSAFSYLHDFLTIKPVDDFIYDFPAFCRRFFSTGFFNQENHFISG
ncbi:MAG: hypothetical protein LBI02_07855 [Opitutaceae bacterium]|nr:hypothetical protein [Opitutaceae bacterium]